MGDDDGPTPAVARAILQMAAALELRTNAEGVERPEVLERLRQPGCDAVQGYLLSRPVPADVVGTLLDSWSMPLPLAPANVRFDAYRLAS